MAFLDAENGHLYVNSAKGVFEFDGLSLYPSKRARRGLLKTVLESKAPVFIPDVHVCKAYKNDDDGLHGLNVRVRYFIPIDELESIMQE